MSETPLISVIIPTFNREKIITRAIKSVINQTYENWELIIVDDFSEDDTQMVVYQYTDERIFYHKLKKNLGNAGARNVGVRLSKADYITFLDSDDEFELKALEIFMGRAHQNSDFDYAFGGYTVFNSDSQKSKKFLWQPKQNASFLEDLKIGLGCGIFIKKSCFDEVGYFDENLRVAVDTDWLIRMDKKYKFEIIEDYLVKVYTHKGERVRQDKSELLKSYKIIYKKNKDLIEKDPFLILRFLYKLQWLSYNQKEIKSGNRYYWRQLNQKIISAKSFITFLIYNIFPLSLAKEIHLKISKSKPKQVLMD